MIRIGKHAGFANLPFITLTAFFIALIPSALLIAPLEGLGAGAWSWVIALGGTWVALTTLFVIGYGTLYGTVEWDPDHRIARLRGREVPIDTITEVWRNESGVRGRAKYLIYRLVSTEGPSVRLLVAAKPFKGLDAADLQNLYRFVAALPLQVPDNGTPGMLSDRQRTLAVTLTGAGGRTRAGTVTLLEELGSMIGARPALDDGFDPRLVEGAPSIPTWRNALNGTLTPVEAGRLLQDWQADDEAAAAILAADISPSRRWRRRFSWLLIAAFGAASVGLIIAIVNGALDRPLLDPAVSSKLPFAIGCAVVLGLGLSLAWCAAADRDVLHRRRLGRASLDERDEYARQRGLATPYLRAWMEPARRIATALWFVAAVPALFLAIGGIALLGRDASGIVMLLFGLAATTGAVFVSVWIYRRRRADAEEMLQLAGWRFMPPESLEVPDRRST